LSPLDVQWTSISPLNVQQGPAILHITRFIFNSRSSNKVFSFHSSNIVRSAIESWRRVLLRLTSKSGYFHLSEKSAVKQNHFLQTKIEIRLLKPKYISIISSGSDISIENN
jgi:hypothetical protein